MIKNYLLIAWRQIVKNKLYAAINIVGLVVGLSVYLFGEMVSTYEETHDAFFANADRIYTVGTVFGPAADIGIAETDGIYAGFGPKIRADVEELEAVARTYVREFLVSIDDDHYYHQIRFADPELLEIFQLDYVEGDSSALRDPSGILLTESAALKFFGPGIAVGKVLTLDHGDDLHVTAVVKDLPQNTHFNSSFVVEQPFELVAPMEALRKASDFDADQDFGNLSMGNLTYVLMPVDRDRAWLQAAMDGVFESHFPDKEEEFIEALRVRPLVELNTMLWDAIGLPVIDSIRVLAFLVLVIAIANYTNLATAQSLGRSREIGLRKTMGAARWQLMLQFIVESLCITALSMLIALALLELLVPVFNGALGRGLVIDYAAILPWLALTTVAVGVAAGAYPAYLITRATPVDALGGAKGTKGGVFRSIMLGLQFAISIFMLAIVFVMALQNQKVAESAKIYPKDQIVTLQRVGVEGIRGRHEALKNELSMLPGVERVAYSSQVPFEQSNSGFGAGRDRGDEDSAFIMNRIWVDEHFFEAYDIPLLQGRNFSRDVGNDVYRDDADERNVVVNELAATRLGFASPADAVGSVFYEFGDDRVRTYQIVGVIPDQNFQGFHNSIKPLTFLVGGDWMRVASVRVDGIRSGEAMTEIEDVWERIVPDYPIQTKPLEDGYMEVYQVFQAMSGVLGGFAGVALALSLIGLFGLAAFMAQNRTKEIGIRKVMGANIVQITKLLVWQFSRPAMWALVVALPAAYLVSTGYVQFFADRVAMPAGIVAGAGVVGVLFAWAVVAVHAIRIARSSPIQALRYE